MKTFSSDYDSLIGGLTNNKSTEITTMQAYYEIETQIPPNHRLNLQLPDCIPAGTAKITVIYEMPEKPETKVTKMAAFLQSLSELTVGEGMSRMAIDSQLRQERQDWD